MTLDWDDVRVFVAVARAGSLMQAVKITGLSQPTLSRRLKCLEDTLGATLFDRLPNQMQLTGLGRRLAELATEMEIAAVNFRRGATVALADLRQPLRISATYSICEFLSKNLDPIAKAALSNGYEVDLVPSRVNANIAHHEVDIAVRLRQFPHDGLMKVRRIGRVGFAMYGPAEHDSGAVRGVIGLSDNRPPPHPGWVDGYALRHGLPIIARLGEYYMRQEAIAAGLGVSLLPCFVGDIDRRLQRLSEPVEELAEDAFLLLHNQAAASTATRDVAAAIGELFRLNAALLAGQTIQPPA